jgi:ribosome-associated toxin RatA of RatAB toxin-antitoxin module
MARSAAVRLPKTLASPPLVASRVNSERIRRTYSTSQWDALAAGEILSAASREADGQHARATGMIRYAARDLWPLLIDFESRPNYLPGAHEIRILRVAGNRVWLAEHVKILFVSIKYHVVNTLEPESGSVSWVLDDAATNDIAATAGAWELVPIAGGRHTLLRYSNVLDTGQPVPGAIERLLLKRSLHQMVSGLRTEAQRRLGN